MSDEVKERLLLVHSSGLYNNLAPSEAISLYHETKTYLEISSKILLTNKYDLKDYFDLTELNFYLSLITNHDTEAKLMLDRLCDKFGDEKKSQRIAILKSIYFEAIGMKYEEIEKFIVQIPDFGKKIDLIKRRTVLTSKLSNQGEYIKDLISYLKVKPSDGQAWFELQEIYLKLGDYNKAIYCVEQILIYYPFAYNIYFQLGKLYQSFAYKTLYDYSKKSDFHYNTATVDKFYSYYWLSLKNYLKSVELCESYHKGWGGVWTLTNGSGLKNKKVEERFVGDEKKMGKLHELAIKKLKELRKDEIFGDEKVV